MKKTGNHILGIDIETYSETDISKAGVYAYASDPAFEILLIAYQLDDGPVKVLETWDRYWQADRLYLDRMKYARGCEEFWDALMDPRTVKCAYNANFERTCLAAWTGKPMPPEQWRCTMVHAATLGLPGSLKAVGLALGLSEEERKDSAGPGLINYFCKPCKPTKANGGRTRNFPYHDPEKWARFIEYNRQDVATESVIRERLSVYPVPDGEQRLWELDQHMNDNGIRVDMDMVRHILAFDETYQEKLMDEARKLTGLENPNSLTQLKDWFLRRCGLEVTSLTKDTIPGLIGGLKEARGGLLLDNDSWRAGTRMLRIRQELGKTSTKKYAAMENAVCPDGRLRGILQFYGANRTGRWAGRIVQVHNLPQNKIPDIALARELAAANDFEGLQELFGELPFVLSQLVRTAFVPSEGNTFIVADFSAIEARVIAWLAREEWRLEVFRTHGKIYEASASQMFHVPIENIKKGSELRQRGKVAELALGYGGSFGAIKAMDKSGSIPDEEIPMLVANWRKASPNICRFWRDAEAAAKIAIQERRTVTLKNGIRFSFVNGILFIHLLSGRKLAYYGAQVEDYEGKESITYDGVDLQKHWGRLETWGGKLVENIVQATARDCLAETMKRVDAAGYSIVMHVHDEIICDVPRKEWDGNQNDLEKITGIMAQPIEWAEGLPLKGDGYVTPFYRKD